MKLKELTGDIRNEELKNIEHITEDLKKQQIPYDVLCWELADFQLLYEKGHGKYTHHDVYVKEEKVFDNSPTYDQLCLIICLYKSLLLKNHLYP